MNDILVECADDVRTSEVECRDDLDGLVSHNELVQETGATNKPSFYNPDIWRTRYLGKPYPLTKVDFDETEQAMIREISHKIGYPRNDVVRMAVRDFYHYNIIAHGK